MFGLHLRYIFALFFLFLFGALFFTSDYILPKICVWKSNQLVNLSKVYLDDSLDNAGGLIDEGIRLARIAHLLNSSNSETLSNYIRLNYRINPANALLDWSKSIEMDQNQEKHLELLNKSITTLKDKSLSLNERSISAEVSYKSINHLMKDKDWKSDPDNLLLFCELLAETGKADNARTHLMDLLDKYPAHPEAVFLLTRLCVHLKDDTQLIELGRSLASLSSQKNDTGLAAIRHMTLLHLLNPLSSRSLDRCIELLQNNPEAKPIDFMRIHALQYASTNDRVVRNQIVEKCASLFDLEDDKNLSVFSTWLARLGDFHNLLKYLSSSKARIDENLFRLRMNALAQVGDFESIHTEVTNAPLIPTLWRMVVEARTFSLQNKTKEALEVLDRLLPLLDDDPREVRNVCFFLEYSKDINGLCHVLERLSDQSIHARFALLKLLEHRSDTASISDLQNWLEKLSIINPEDNMVLISKLYLKILNPKLPTPSTQLDELIIQVQKLLERSQLPQVRITLALGHLRNNQPDKSLVALGPAKDWREWINSRAAWSLIASQVYKLNKDSEKSMVLRDGVDFDKLDFAEKESLESLFPSLF